MTACSRRETPATATHRKLPPQKRSNPLYLRKWLKTDRKRKKALTLKSGEKSAKNKIFYHIYSFQKELSHADQHMASTFNCYKCIFILKISAFSMKELHVSAIQSFSAYQKHQT